MSILFKIGNTVVFYGINLDPNVSLELTSGDKIGYDFDGNAMSGEQARIQYFKYCDRDTSNQTKANIDLSSTVLSVVRNDLLYLPQTDAILTMASMSEIIFMVQMGMYATAATQLDTTARTSILTDDRLNKYATMLRSADAIEVT